MRCMLVVAIVACSKPEPPPAYAPYEVYLADFPRCPGASGFVHPLLVRLTEGDRTKKELFMRAPDGTARGYKLIVNRHSPRVDLSFGICAEARDPKQARYNCEAPTVDWYATAPVVLDPNAPFATAGFTMPSQPIRCLGGGTAVLRPLKP